MSERCQDVGREPDCSRDALAIHTRKITDSCRDKDCIEDLRVFLTKSSQCTLDSASGVRVRCAELLYAYIDVEPVAFDRNHYCIDVTFYYRILADAVVGCNRPQPCTVWPASPSGQFYAVRTAAPISSPPTPVFADRTAPAVPVPTAPPLWWRFWILWFSVPKCGKSVTAAVRS